MSPLPADWQWVSSGLGPAGGDSLGVTSKRWRLMSISSAAEPWHNNYTRLGPLTHQATRTRRSQFRVTADQSEGRTGSADQERADCCPVPLQWVSSELSAPFRRTIRTIPTQLGQEAVSGRIISWGSSPVVTSRLVTKWPDNWQNISY